MTKEDMRELALHGGPKGFNKALSRARTTQAGAVRCVMLAWVARYAPDDAVASVAEEALANAFSDADFYQTVSRAAWPLRALVERGREQRILAYLPKLVGCSDKIAHPVCRMDALYLVWQAVYPAHLPGTKSVLEKLVAVCLAADSWRAGQTMRDVIIAVAHEDANEAARFIAALPEGVYKRQSQRRVAEGEPGYVRTFFW